MARDLTVTFDDGSSHVYANAPDDVTFEKALARAQTDFKGKAIKNIDGGRPAAPAAEEKPAPSETVARQSVQGRTTTPSYLGTSGVSMAEAEEMPTRPAPKGKSIFERGVKMEPPTVDYQKNLDTMRQSGSPESIMFSPGRQLEAIDQQIMRGEASQRRVGEAAANKAAQKAAAEKAKLQQQAEAESNQGALGTTADILKDTGIGLVGKGGLNALQGIAGLSELATGFIPGDKNINPLQIGQWGKMLDRLDSEFGINFEKGNKFLTGLQSAKMQQQLGNVDEAKGFFNTVKAVGVNPLALVDNILSSIPTMLTGGAAAGSVTRMWVTKAAKEAKALNLTGAAAEKFIKDKVGTVARLTSYAAEGALTAGGVADQARSMGVDWEDYVLPALSAGVGTALIGVGAGKVGTKLGIGDIEADIAAKMAGVKGSGIGVGDTNKGFAKFVFGEMAKEGLLEEMPQSAQEQIFTNLATGRPWDENLGKSAALGLTAGAGMGGGHAISSKALQRTAEIVDAGKTKLAGQTNIPTGQDYTDLAKSKGFLRPEQQTQQQAPPPPADTDLGLVGEARPGEDNVQPPAPPSPVQEQAEPAKETSDRVEKLVKRGVPRADAIAMAEKGKAPAGIPTKIDTWTDTALQSTLDLQMNKPEAERNAPLVQSIQAEIQKRTATQGETNVERPVDTGIGTSPAVDQQASGEPAAQGAEQQGEPGGVVQPDTTVAQLDGRENAQPAPLETAEEQAPAEVVEEAAPVELSREEKLKTATDAELEEALTKIGSSDISYLSVPTIQAEIDRRKAEAEAAAAAKQKTETRGRKADAPDVKAAKAAKNKAYGAKRQAAKRAFDENQDNALKQLAEANIPLDEDSFADEESLAQAQEDKRAKKASAINKLLDVEELEHGRPLGKKAKAILNDRTKISQQELDKVKKGREVRKKTDLKGEVKTNTPLANRRSTGKVDAKFSKFTNGAQAITHIIRTGNIFQKFLAARLRPFVANVKFVVIEKGDPLPSQLQEYADDWEESRGLYFGAEEGSKPTIYVRGESFGQDQGINNITVLHELLHAATNTKITLGLLARSKGISRDAALTNFIGDLSSLMENAKVNYERMLARGMISPQLRVVVESAGEVDPQTGEVTSDIFEIPQEFLAYGMSDENFQDFLDSIEGKSNEGSGWSRFTRMIANLFGLGRGNYTALSDLMHVTDKILSTKATPEMRAMEAGAQAPSAAKLPEDRTEKEKAKAVDYMLKAVDKSKTAEEFSKATSTLQRLRRGDVKGLVRAASEGFTYKQRQALAVLLPTPELADIGGIRVPELINTNELLSEMEGLQAQMMEAGANTVTNLMKLLPEQESRDKVNQAVLVSTGAKIDPRVDTSVPQLNNLYNALTDNEKAAYAEVFDYYDNMADYVEHLMEESVKSLGLSDDKTILAAVRDVLHSSNRIKPYAPLLRDQGGDYWLRVGSGKSLEVYTRKSKDERDSLARMIAEERNTTVDQLIDDSEIEVGNKIADMRQKIVDSSDALRKMFLMIDNADFATTDTKPLLKAREGMKDTIFQLWLHMQPENSARKQFMHRAENPPAGFKTDVIQGIAESAIKFSTHTAKLKYGPKLRASVSQAKSYIRKDPDATPYVEEMTLRVFDTLAPERDSAAMAAVQFANAYTYGYYMTESTALIQLLGGYQMGMAQLAKEHSIADVTKTMGSFAAVWNSMGVHDANGDWVMPTIVDGARLKNSAKDTPEERLRKESLRAGLEEMKLRNVAESTAVRDLNGYKDIPTERYGSGYEQTKRAARFLVGGLGHAAERLSREIVYASAFSLTRDKALAKFYNTTAYKASTDKVALTRAFQNDNLKKWSYKAARDTEKALFKYTPSAKPRWMRNAVGKFAFQFFTYKLNIGVFLARNLLGMIKPLPGETRAECRRAFLTLMGTTWTLSGVSGMFGVSAVFGLVSTLMRLGRDPEDPDELKDVDTMEAFRVWLHDHLGHVTIGGVELENLDNVIYKGLLNQLTGLEFAARTSVADIGMPPDVKDTRTLSDGVVEYMKKFGGADLSAFLSTAQGLQMMIDGDIQRGLEKFVPWAALRNKMIAVRYAMEGETGTKFSDEIVEAEQFHLGELIGQSVGLRPVLVTDVMAANRKATEIINRVTMRRTEILEQIGKADDKGDLDREIKWLEKKDKFNDKYGDLFPKMVISDENVTDFKNNRGERRSRTWAGFEFTDKNQVLADEITGASRDALIKREREIAQSKKEKAQSKREVSGQLERQ
jgi:hypothetical protein